MLTDDVLIRELGSGFREESAGLTYAGRVPTPRRTVVPWTAVPLAAATAAVVVLPQLGGGSPSSTPRPAPSVAPSVPARTTAPVVVQQVSLAAFQSAVANAGDDWPPLEFSIGVNDIEVPADARPVDGVAAPNKAWIGTDAKTGLPTLWVAAPSRNEGLTFTASGEGWSADQLVHLLLTGERGRG
jgi:hypothetical protein